MDEYNNESPKVKQEVEKARDEGFDGGEGNEDVSDDEADAKESQRKNAASAMQR
jgi:hypothetical protein